MQKFKTIAVKCKKPHSKYGRIIIVDVPKEVTIEDLESVIDGEILQSVDVHYLKSLASEKSLNEEFSHRYVNDASKLLNKEFRDSYINSQKVDLLRILCDFKCKEVTKILDSELKKLKVLITDEIRRELGLMIINGELRIPERITDVTSVKYKLTPNGKLRKVN